MAEPNNVDPRETEKFGRISALWWDPKGPMHSLHDINPLRTRFIAEGAPVADRQVLDIGCGGGLLCESLAKLGAHVTGIDLSDELIQVAKAHAKQQGLGIDYQHVSAERLAEERPSSFDVVTCMEVLEHIPNPGAVVAACARLLKPGGHVFFSTINRSLKSFVMVIVGGEYIIRLLPIGSHTYWRLIRPNELRTWASASGLIFVNSATMNYNPFTGKFSVAPGEDMSYMMHFQRESSI